MRSPICEPPRCCFLSPVFISLTLFFFCPSDSEPTEPLSMDGNSSELELEVEEDEEEDKGPGGGECRKRVPQTPDQEAFLKEHFVMLAELSASGTAAELSN